MIKYRIFHIGYAGALHDSCSCGVFDDEFGRKDYNFDTQADCAESLRVWNVCGWLRKDLTFVILPVFVGE